VPDCSHSQVKEIGIQTRGESRKYYVCLQNSGEHLLERQGSGNHERDLMKQIKYFGIIALCAAAFSVLMAQTKPSNPSVPGNNPPSVPNPPRAPGNNPPSVPGNNPPSVPGNNPPRGPGNTNPSLPNGNVPSLPNGNIPSVPGTPNPALPGTPNPALPGTPNPALPIGSPAANAVPSISPIPTTTPR
jgi:hypothetical protein